MLSGQGVINEIDSDTPGMDTREFIELYDGGSGGTPLDSLTLVFSTATGMRPSSPLISMDNPPTRRVIS